jgi:hypothetical protein
MFARLGAKAFLLMVGVALIFFGVGLIEFGVAAALKPFLGPVWGDVVAGAIFLAPPLIWALAVVSTRPARRRASGIHPIVTALFAALAKETPWVAVLGAGLASAAELFLNRNKSGE